MKECVGIIGMEYIPATAGIAGKAGLKGNMEALRAIEDLMSSASTPGGRG